MAHAGVPLDAAGLAAAEYVLYVADETGPWRALTPFARDLVEEAGYDPARTVSDGPFAGDIDEPVAALGRGETTEAGATGALRQFAMDRPAALAAHLDTLLAALADADLDPEGERGPTARATTSGSPSSRTPPTPSPGPPGPTRERWPSASTRCSRPRARRASRRATARCCSTSWTCWTRSGARTPPGRPRRSPSASRTRSAPSRR
ncbi:hypothetical protein [Halosegnis marinus]|uniref:hypothetical protein n=1 Tax=Halosegnis marinus TaxID=3034023 RepID=UPI00360758F0